MVLSGLHIGYRQVYRFLSQIWPILIPSLCPFSGLLLISCAKEVRNFHEPNCWLFYSLRNERGGSKSSEIFCHALAEAGFLRPVFIRPMRDHANPIAR